MSGWLTVTAPGPLCTVQDVTGRPGRADLGVGVSGAADRAALRRANRLVGNDEAAAGLEVTFGGLGFRVTTTSVVALTGAPVPVTVGERPGDLHRAVVVPAGAEVRLGTPPSGLRTYVAVRGGLAVDPVLGSRATDTVAGLGPPVLGAGAELPVGVPPSSPVPSVDVAPEAGLAGEVVLGVVPGPRDDWFTDAALATFLRTAWTVTEDANRVGFRLDGPELARTAEREGAELPSEGVIRGSVQVPPSGRPTVFLADHPVTGGYPVIGVVLDADTDRAGQARPGSTVRFRRVGLSAVSHRRR
ncbi:biotin-dependent carboxyltransferase family protein [Actinomycetospora sp. TBRC 11914]|uniref:5-oxoprolinase subunit C family protein n=1 Tax=Actinomycetospora sp. TBRC 11914 TaxID=2729387 RepID=UPI00145E4337|nr:biotin-dependent carboxyltransferase family protein [Actinomycetospora sp. TBRC 11914]NMO89877.1 biotin-dependent carboxyltransferase family protein [Actinomycetospora sp. TBRC 11914]